MTNILLGYYAARKTTFSFRLTKISLRHRSIVHGLSVLLSRELWFQTKLHWPFVIGEQQQQNVVVQQVGQWRRKYHRPFQRPPGRDSSNALSWIATMALANVFFRCQGCRPQVLGVVLPRPIVPFLADEGYRTRSLRIS